MSHHLYRTDDGRYAFVSTQPEWHSLGEIADKPMSAIGAMQRTGLDKMVLIEGTGLYTQHMGHQFEFASHKGMLLYDSRSNTYRPAAVVGKTRKIFQFMDLAEPLEQLVKHSGGGIETFGLFDTGAQWFGSVRLPEDVIIGGDEHRIYVLGTDSLHGSFTMGATAIRVRCKNTFDAAMMDINGQGAAYRYSVRHTSGAQIDIEEIKAAIKISYKYAEDLDRVSRIMLDQQFTDSEFDRLIASVFDDPEMVNKTRRAKLRSLFSGMGESTETTYRGGHPTKWTAYQSISEYLDWYAPVRGNPLARRLERTFDGSVQKIKAFSLQGLM